ncbi:MAG: metal-dependent hydrolase [Desulfobacteraceae bacterium]|nr:metal-dependent hydrolase [Desulfobacteraceae bacterium]MCB9494806.1 metal-dependent hydrolase [Desulfobacteraceae bacterium]
MPDFKAHSEAGVLAGYAAGALSLYFLDKPVYFSGIIFVSSYAGSIFPDIDSDNSRTISIIFNLLSVLGAFAAISFFIDSTWKYAFLIPPAVYFFIKFGLSGIFKYYSRHRGIYHSIPMGIFISLVIFKFSTIKLDEISGFVTGLSFLFGYLVHLVLDEINSLYDIKSAKFNLKKSFGTALSIKGVDIYTTVFVYLGILILVFLNYDALFRGFNYLKSFFIPR